MFSPLNVANNALWLIVPVSVRQLAWFGLHCCSGERALHSHGHVLGRASALRVYIRHAPEGVASILSFQLMHL